MKINRKAAQAVLLMVITGLAFGLITYVNQSACTIAFYQPVQPDNIQNKILFVGSDHEKFCKVFLN